jgi:hypothetical protein
VWLNNAPGAKNLRPRRCVSHSHGLAHCMTVLDCRGTAVGHGLQCTRARAVGMSDRLFRCRLVTISDDARWYECCADRRVQPRASEALSVGPINFVAVATQNIPPPRAWQRTSSSNDKAQEFSWACLGCAAKHLRHSYSPGKTPGPNSPSCIQSHARGPLRRWTVSWPLAWSCHIQPPRVYRVKESQQMRVESCSKRCRLRADIGAKERRKASLLRRQNVAFPPTWGGMRRTDPTACVNNA